MPIAFFNDDGWWCSLCGDFYGSIPNIMWHLVNEEQVKQWTVDSKAGLIYDGLVEMACVGMEE